MALQLSYDDKFGVTHVSAYYRVTRLRLDVMNRTTRASIGVFANATASVDEKAPIELIQYMWEGDVHDALFGIAALEAKNPVKAVYDDIKTFPEYADAIDV